MTSTFMLRGRRCTFGHRPSCCVAGVALGNIVLTTIFLIGGFFLVLFSLWNAPGFQSIAPVSKSHVCVVGIVLMICIILCSKVGRKWLCSKVMHQTLFQSDRATRRARRVRRGEPVEPVEPVGVQKGSSLSSLAPPHPPRLKCDG